METRNRFMGNRKAIIGQMLKETFRQ